jgi:hypothetical protein
MKFSNLGIIRIAMPAMRAMIGEMCAGVRVMMIVGSYLVIAHRTCALAATIQKN